MATALVRAIARLLTSNVFCATGPGGGVDPSCTIQSGDTVGGKKIAKPDSKSETRYIVKRRDYAEKRGTGGSFHNAWHVFDTKTGSYGSSIYTSESAAQFAVDRSNATVKPDSKITSSPARFAKGKVAVKAETEEGFKSQAARVLEGVGGRWSNREKAYIMSPTQLKKAEKALAEGKDWSPITGEWREKESA